MKGRSTPVWGTTIGGLDVTLKYQPCAHRDRGFTLKYGEEVHDHLDYESATIHLGRSILHALTCQGKIDS